MSSLIARPSRSSLSHWMGVQVRCQGKATNSGIAAKALMTELHAMFRAVILLHHLPRTLIQLSIQCTSKPSVTSSTVHISLDGHGQSHDEAHRDAQPLLLGPDATFLASEVASFINASSLALLDASIPLRATVAAAACAVLDCTDANRAFVPETDKTCVLVDPTPTEESVAHSCHVFAFAFSGYDPAAPEKTELAVQLVYCSSTGRTSSAQRFKLLEVAKKSAMETYLYARSVVEAQME